MKEKDIERAGLGGLLGVNRGSTHPPRLIELAYEPTQCPRFAGARRQGHHVRFRRPLAEDGRRDDDDEGRHGRRGRDPRRVRGHELGRAPLSGARLHPCHRQHAGGRRHTSPATCSRSATARRSRCSTPTPRAGSCWPTRLSLASEAQPDAILDLATLDGRGRGRAGQPHRGVDGQRRGAGPTRFASRLTRAGERVWELPLPARLPQGARLGRRRPAQRGATRGARFDRRRLFLHEFVAPASPGRTSTSPARCDGRWRRRRSCTPGGTALGVRTSSSCSTFQPGRRATSRAPSPSSPHRPTAEWAVDRRPTACVRAGGVGREAPRGLLLLGPVRRRRGDGRDENRQCCELALGASRRLADLEQRSASGGPAALVDRRRRTGCGSVQSCARVCSARVAARAGGRSSGGSLRRTASVSLCD